MSSTLRAYLVLGAVFVLGSLTGAASMYAHGRRAHGPFSEGFHARTHSERRVSALNRELGLSPEQSDKVGAVLERHHSERSRLMHETIDRCGEPLRKLRATSDAEIREILSAEQQKRFDELLHNRDRRSPARPSSP